MQAGRRSLSSAEWIVTRLRSVTGILVLLLLAVTGCRSTDVATSESRVRDKEALQRDTGLARGDQTPQAGTPWWLKHQAAQAAPAGDNNPFTSTSHHTGHDVFTPAQNNGIRLLHPEPLHRPDGPLQPSP